MNDNRTQLRTKFLKQLKDFEEIHFLASDMSNRKYYRVLSQKKSYVLMDASDFQELERFLKIQHILRDMDIRVPEKYFEDFENGFLLIEDFGDLTLTNALKDDNLKRQECDFYKKSILVLHDIYERYDEKKPPLSEYGKNIHLHEASAFVDYYFLFIHQKEINASIKNDWLHLWEKALSEALPLAPHTLVLRDYHVDNIILLKNGSLGILDFQDALYGSIMYDYISLVEDARREISKSLYKDTTSLFLSVFDASKHKDYLQNAAVVGACRHAKILGYFTRYKLLYKNDSKLTYLPHVFNLFIKALERSEQTEILYFLKDQGFLKGVK